jgi:hypothetical protein
MPATPAEHAPRVAPIDDRALAAALAQFDREGWASLGIVVPPPTLALLRARIEAIMLGEIVHEGLFFQADAATGRYEDTPRGLGWQGPSLDYRKLEKLERDPLLRAYLEAETFETVVRARIEGPIALYRAIVMNKGPAGGSDLPWHQDGGTFWGLDRDPELQLWTAIDDAPAEAGCLEIVPGTHRAGLATPLGGVIPQEIVESARAEERRILVPAVAGEVILIHNHVWHRSGANRTGRARRGLSVCYMSAATRCMRRKRAPRTFVRLFDHP